MGVPPAISLDSADESGREGAMIKAVPGLPPIQSPPRNFLTTYYLTP